MKYLLVAESKKKKPLYLLMVNQKEILIDVVKVLRDREPKVEASYRILHVTEIETV